MLAGWLLATASAVGVAWIGVHPVADLGSPEGPPVPRPEIADSPRYDGDSARLDTGSSRRRPSEPADSRAEDSARPSPDGSAIPTRTTAKPEPSRRPGSPPASPTPPPSYAPPDTVYRETSTVGGTATFEYVQGQDVYVVDAQPNPGWQVTAYRYHRDWVVVEFERYDHRSTLHAYIDRGRPVVEVVEEDTGW